MYKRGHFKRSGTIFYRESNTDGTDRETHLQGMRLLTVASRRAIPTVREPRIDTYQLNIWLHLPTTVMG